MSEDVYHIEQEYGNGDLILFYICGTTYPDKSYRIIRPKSKVYSIEYVEEGAGIVHIDDETFYPQAGDSYLLQVGKDHIYYSNTKTPWKKHFINLYGKLVDSLVECYNLSNKSHFIGLDTGEELKQIIEIVKTQPQNYTPEIVAVLNKIFFKMHLHVNVEKELPQIAIDMKNFLNAQCTKKFNIDRLCKHVSLSEAQTIKLFKQFFDTTPYQYVLNKKISLSKNILENTNLSVKDIAEQLCFSSEYAFSNAFKKIVGSSPRRYRYWSTNQFGK